MPPLIEPLTAAAFKPFGNVIEVTDTTDHFPINYGLTTRFHDLAEINTQGNQGRTSVNIFRSMPMTFPMHLTIMERHPLSSQAFFPLSQHAYLVVVAAKGDFDPATIKLFLAHPNQGVNYHAGTWHHFSLALTGCSDFLVIDRIGPGENCEEVTLTEPIVVQQEDIPL